MITKDIVLAQIINFMSGKISKAKLVKWAEDTLLDYLEDKVEYEEGYEEIIEGYLSTLAGLDIPGFVVCEGTELG
jgi:hypothetical protein